MKQRLVPLLEGMEMGKSEHDWLEQRLESMTAKEELLFRGAMQIESPRDIQTTIQILQGLDHYQLLYGAEDDVLLGRFVMEHIHTPTHAARGYLDPEIVGAAYREHGSGSFVENHYVERLNPDRPCSFFFIRISSRCGAFNDLSVFQPSASRSSVFSRAMSRSIRATRLKGVMR